MFCFSLTAFENSKEIHGERNKRSNHESMRCVHDRFMYVWDFNANAMSILCAIIISISLLVFFSSFSSRVVFVFARCNVVKLRENECLPYTVYIVAPCHSNFPQ